MPSQMEGFSFTQMDTIPIPLNTLILLPYPKICKKAF